MMHCQIGITPSVPYSQVGNVRARFDLIDLLDLLWRVFYDCLVRQGTVWGVISFKGVSGIEHGDHDLLARIVEIQDPTDDSIVDKRYD